MPQRTRPAKTTRSEHWLRVAANDAHEFTNEQIRVTFGWSDDEQIEWKSPVLADEYAEYYDESFLDQLGVGELKFPLRSFWPASGPRWDGLARTSSGNLILVEAKAYIEEAVDFGSGAGEKSLTQIKNALEKTKEAFGANKHANWECPFYQYANRLAHLYFLAVENELDAYLVFLNLANAPDVPSPCTAAEWEGGRRVIERSLGLGNHPYRQRVKTIVIDVEELKRHSNG